MWPWLDRFDANSVPDLAAVLALGIGSFTFFQQVEHLLGHDIFLQLGQLRVVLHFHLKAGRALPSSDGRNNRFAPD